jgi:hypothetical protein
MSSRTAGTIIASLLLMGPSGSAQAKVTGITFEPKDPIVGHSVTAIATDDRNHEVAQWAWHFTLADAGTWGSPTVMKPLAPGRATLTLLCGGTYTVSLRVTYGGPMAPPPETVSVPLVIARPDDHKIIQGIDKPVRYEETGSGIEIRSQVRSRGKDVGEHLLGTAQRRVRNRTWWDGKKDPDRPWEPKFPPGSFFQMRGVIKSLVILDIAPGDWAKIRPGGPVVSWDEDARLVYGIGSLRHEGDVSHHGGGKAVTVECPLGTKPLSIVKVDDDHWAVREGVRAGADGP